MARFWLYLMRPDQLVEAALGAHNAHRSMPPPGMTRGIDVAALARAEVDPLVDGTLPLYVDGQPPAGTEDDWYWGTLGDFLLELPDLDSALLNRVLQLAARTAGTVLADALSVPLLKKGTASGTMRWLRVTHRGVLGGGVEQFQFKVDLGNPGSDPDLDEAGRDALALDLKTVFATAWAAHSTHWDSEVAFTEIGVAQITQTSATDAQGQGGNQAQDGGTSWELFPIPGGAGQVSGGGVGPALPFEVALAVTLVTDHRGPSGRGRLYLPPPSTSAMGYDGTFLTAVVTEAGALITSYFAGIKDATTYEPIVVSPRRLILNTITSIAVGKVPDSQRRRRRSQDEARVATVIP